MSEEYLWDRTGAPDREIADLEKSLAALQYQPRPQPKFETPRRAPERHFFWLAAGIAAVALLAVAVSIGSRHFTMRTPEPSTWKLSAAGKAARAVRPGQLIQTGNSGARLDSEFVGEVRVGPQSVLRVLESTKDQQRLDLQHGTIHALIWAPPRQFVVDTPSSRTVDLGCQYTLHVAAGGTGFLNVETGWVAFQWKNLESFIPAGAACTTRPGSGPGMPYFEDAPAALRAAIARFDADGDTAALATVLQNARPRDALTLWHLLTRTAGGERAAVFDRFSELVKLPPSVTKQEVMKGDPKALDAAWNALNLGNTNWWREWKRKW